jgi:hypothetical protein
MSDETERDEIAEQLKAERAAAHANAAPADEPRIQPINIPAPDAGDNELKACQFATILTEAGLPCRAMKTNAIAGRGPVRDGWVVNARCEDTEIGIVGAWWGLGHFTAYIEITGHGGRTVEAAEMLASAWLRRHGPVEVEE